MMTTDYPALIKELRTALGLTQEALAHELGVSFTTVNGWENGHRRPQPYLARHLLSLAEKAGVDPGAFRRLAGG